MRNHSMIVYHPEALQMLGSGVFNNDIFFLLLKLHLFKILINPL